MQFLPFAEVVDFCLIMLLALVVRIPRLLAVVVSIKKYSAPPVFFISGYVHTAVLVYDRKQKRVERMHISELIPTPNPPRIQKERKKNILYVPFSRWPLVPASSAPLDIAC